MGCASSNASLTVHRLEQDAATTPAAAPAAVAVAGGATSDLGIAHPLFFIIFNYIFTHISNFSKILYQLKFICKKYILKM